MRATGMLRLAVLPLLVIALVTPTSSAAAASTAVSPPTQRNLLCEVSVQRLSAMWDGLEAWAEGAQQSGDAVADAMLEVIGSADPSDAEVLAMQQETAGYYLTGMRDFRSSDMAADLREITRLSGQIRSSVPARYHAFVKARVAKIRSLYTEYWQTQFAPTYIRGLQALTSANPEGWTRATEPLPAKVPLARADFARAFRGLPKIC